MEHQAGTEAAFREFWENDEKEMDFIFGRGTFVRLPCRVREGERCSGG